MLKVQFIDFRKLKTENLLFRTDIPDLVVEGWSKWLNNTVDDEKPQIVKKKIN